MKMPLEWHEECLANSEQYLAERKRQIFRLQQEILRLGDNIDHYRKQIEVAKRLKRDSFDAERFMRGAK